MPLMPEEGWKFERDLGHHIELATGRQFITCTTALREASCMDFKHPDGSFFYMWRGEQIHDFVEKVLTEKPEEAKITKLFNALGNVSGHGYAAGFLKFQREVPFEVILHDGIPMVERKIFHPLYGFAGKFDFAAMLGGMPALIDVKTGVRFGWHGPQCSAYVLGATGSLWESPEGVRRYGLYLNKNGTYKLHRHEDDAEDEIVFLSAVAIAKWKRKVS